MSDTPDTPCVAYLRKLQAAIEERTLGELATSVGHKGRTVQFAEVSVEKMINIYRQRWAACPDAAAAGLPEMQPLDGPVGARAPARFMGRGYV